MAKRTYGCTSVINAVNLQFELAGHGLYTDLKRSKGGQWLAEHTIKRANTMTRPGVGSADLEPVHGVKGWAGA